MSDITSSPKPNKQSDKPKNQNEPVPPFLAPKGAMVLTQASAYAGPIPSAEMMQKFKDVDPAIVAAILEDFQQRALIEREQEVLDRQYRRDADRELRNRYGDQTDVMISNEYNLSRNGQSFAFGSVSLFAIIAVIAMFTGHDLVAEIFGGSGGLTLCYLVYAFIKGKWAKPPGMTADEKDKDKAIEKAAA